MIHKYRNRKARGFSLLELIIVVSMLLVIAAISIPNMMSVIANARLRAGTTSLSGMLQSCRMMAIKHNKTMTTHFTVMAYGPVAYVKDATDSGSLTNMDPQVQLGAPVNKVTTPTGTGAPSALDSTTLGFTPQTGDPSFNPRGMPCAYSGGTCANKGFVYYFTDSRPLGKAGWAAVTISPAGRVTKYFWDGSNWAQ